MEKYKLLTPDCLVDGEYYQQYDINGDAYCIVVKAGNPCIHIQYYFGFPGIGVEPFPENYLYAKISEHSFNRIKRIVMNKLGI